MNKPDNYNEGNLVTYQQLIVKLIYFACGTKPDIAFAIEKLGKHNANSCKKHLRAVKQIIRYLKGTIHLELVYGQYPDRSLPTLLAPYGLVRYKDSNFAGDQKDRKSVMRYCFFLNGALIL